MVTRMVRRSAVLLVLVLISGGSLVTQPAHPPVAQAHSSNDHQSQASPRQGTGVGTPDTTLLAKAAATSLPLSTPTAPVTDTLPITPTATPRPPSPSPTPPPRSTEAQRALSFIAQREQIPAEQLFIESESHRDEPLLGRSFQVVTVMHRRDGRFFIILVDRSTGAFEELPTINAAVRQARFAKYGKFQPALYERLQQLQATDMVTVTIMVAANPGQSLHGRMEAARATLAAKYSEARDAIARKRQPMDVGDPVLARKIYKEYVALLGANIPRVVRPLQNWLSAQGYSATTLPELPAVTVTVPKQAIASLVARRDVGTLFLVENSPVVQAGSALQAPSPQVVPPCTPPYTCSPNDTNRATKVWDQGIDGTGIKIAVLEAGRVDFTATSSECSQGKNCFRYTGPITQNMRIPGTIQLDLDEKIAMLLL